MVNVKEIEANKRVNCSGGRSEEHMENWHITTFQGKNVEKARILREL